MGGQPADALAGVFDLGSISELSSAILPTAVAGVVNNEAVGEMMGQALEQCHDPLVEWVAERIAGDAGDFVDEWIAAERDWNKFTNK